MEIRRCRLDELDQVMAFIRDNWAEDHILASNRPLMLFQHGDPTDSSHCNWILAVSGGAIVGVLGYIPTRVYDAGLADDSVLWLALWKIDDRVTSSGLGVRMLRAMERVEPNVAIGVLGINPEHPPMYRALGYETGELSQHVMFAQDAQFRLAVVPADFVPHPVCPGRAILTRVDREFGLSESSAFDVEDRHSWLPRKSTAYFAARYSAHPMYNYEIFEVSIDGRNSGLLVTRVAHHDGATALRIVDGYLDSATFSELGPAIRALLSDTGAEYADLWQHGVEEEHLVWAGFHRVDASGDVIVPNFYEPFVQRNGRIEFAMKHGPLPFVLFRGDGDQDRPNTAPRQVGVDR